MTAASGGVFDLRIAEVRGKGNGKHFAGGVPADLEITARQMCELKIYNCKQGIFGTWNNQYRSSCGIMNANGKGYRIDHYRNIYFTILRKMEIAIPQN